MPDMEKVISGLQRCRLINKINCDKCPYDYNGRGNGKSECTAELAEDVLALLKERAKTKVVFGRTKDGEFVTECGNCGTYLDKAYSNCPKCKKELDWSSNQT